MGGMWHDGFGFGVLWRRRESVQTKRVCALCGLSQLKRLEQSCCVRWMLVFNFVIHPPENCPGILDISTKK
jgi:hypothetical protein